MPRRRLVPCDGTLRRDVADPPSLVKDLLKLVADKPQQVKTQPKIVELVDKLLDEHIYSEIADVLNAQGFRPGGSARRGKSDARFTALRVGYLVHTYGLRSRYDRLRDRGMLTKEEITTRLDIHEQTLLRWADHGIVKRHAYNAHAYLYEAPGPNPPIKQCSRWNRLADRAKNTQTKRASKPSHPITGGAV